MKQTRNPIALLPLLLALAAGNAVAQVKTPPKTSTQQKTNTPSKPVGTKVTSTYQASGSADVSQIEPKAPTLNRLEKGKTDLEIEQKEIERLRTQAKTNCELEELKFREQDVAFLRKNAAQIAEVVGTVRKGLKHQLTLLRGYENGSADGEDKVAYTTPDGKEDSSAIIEFNGLDNTGKMGRIQVPVKNLISYIRKYEEEAARAKTPEEIAALLKKYRDPNTANDPKFFYLTLDRALKAYADCGLTGCLASVFRKSYNQEQSREMFVGSGKDLFRIRTTTTLGWNPTYNTRVGTLLRKDLNDQSNVQLSISMNFGEAFQQAKEDNYWSVIRAQQLTIDGIPVDGYLRRIYFDSLRSPECQRGNAYTFNPNTDPGPYFSYDQKEICTKTGMEILSASMTKTRDYNGRARVGTIFDLTSIFKQMGDSRDSISSRNGFYDQVASAGFGSCDDVSLQMTYRCGCERTPRNYNQPYKLGHPITIGCN